jgi:hypothetical protein
LGKQKAEITKSNAEKLRCPLGKAEIGKAES